MKEKYIDECKQIQQNCTYNAETHHQIAVTYKRLTLGFQLLPAAIAAITSSLTAAGASWSGLPVLTVISAVTVAVTTVLDPNRRYQENLSAAKNFTTLKHDARFLHESEATALSDDAFFVRVANLHQKYNDLVTSVPPTNSYFFAKARKVVQDEIHTPDKDKKGRIK